MNRELFEVRGNSLVIHVPEELDHHNAEPIRQGADQILEKQQLKQVIFDFQETVFMDSSGIGVIMGRYRNMDCLGGKVSAVHVGERIDRIFRLSGLYKLIPVNREAIWSHKGE